MMTKETRRWVTLVALLGVAGGCTIWIVLFNASHRKQTESEIIIQPTLAQDVPKIGIAAYNGETNEVNRLIASKADIENTGSDKRSALLLACASNQAGVVAILLKAGANANAQDAAGKGPLHWATSQRNLETVELLLSHGADVNAQDKNGETPLIVSAVCGHLEIARALLAAGADQGLADRDGLTALTWANRNHHPELAALLTQ